jgi:dipeptidase D
VRDAYTAAFGAVLGGEMDVVAIHAGLECGYIKKQVPDMDIISIGPDMKGIHSPDEVLYLDSVERVWKVVARMITDWCVEG